MVVAFGGTHETPPMDITQPARSPAQRSTMAPFAGGWIDQDWLVAYSWRVPKPNKSMRRSCTSNKLLDRLEALQGERAAARRVSNALNAEEVDLIRSLQRRGVPDLLVAQRVLGTRDARACANLRQRRRRARVEAKQP